jgi:aspartate racemase
MSGSSRVGLVGGLGPESTIDYYRRLIKEWEQDDPHSSPPVVIDSLDSKLVMRLVGHELPTLAEYLFESLNRLKGAGATFGAITSNTTHLVFDALAPRSPIPLISIVDTCLEEARRSGLKRLAILGTHWLMQARLYPDAARARGIDIVVPPTSDCRWLHERYVGELVKGDLREETRRGVVMIAERLRDEQRVDGVILGGTELPLLIREATIAGLPVLDTTGLHVAAILERLRA